MSFGGSQGTNNGAAALVGDTHNIYTPFGSLKNSKGTTSEQVNQTSYGPYQRQLWQSEIGQQQNAVNALPKSFSVQDAFNNPYTNAIYQQQSAPIMRQYTQDQNALNNTLNASNQMGSSYDALRNNQLQQNRDYNLNQALGNATQYGYNAYNQQFQNNINQIGGLQSALTSQYANTLAPFTGAAGIQSQAFNPLQQSSAQYALAQQAQQGQMLSGLTNALVGGAQTAMRFA